MNTYESSIKGFPTLFGVSSTGKIKQWNIRVDLYDSFSEIVTEYGYVNGKLQNSCKKITVGKNIGRANETTHAEQAVLEARSKWNSQKDKGYFEDIDNPPERVVLPMLAHNFRKRAHSIEYPCYVQPKLNGVRCLAKKDSEDHITFTSRQGKEFENFPTIAEGLIGLMKVGEIFDGELYHHDWNFQQIVSAVKNTANPDRNYLYLEVYDIVNDSPFRDRNELIANRFNSLIDCVVPVYTTICEDEEEVYTWHNKFVGADYEGVIIRNANGLYTPGHRSADLQKYKEFIDEEFEIAGGRADVDGGVVFLCYSKNNAHDTFKIRPKGSLTYRQHLWYSLDKLIGKSLTVRYQNLSEDGIPIFPVGIAIRDYE